MHLTDQERAVAEYLGSKVELILQLPDGLRDETLMAHCTNIVEITATNALLTAHGLQDGEFDDDEFFRLSKLVPAAINVKSKDFLEKTLELVRQTAEVNLMIREMK